eukprot:scaffold267520_cov43-Prasinocladus_malaysianus.AAC.1
MVAGCLATASPPRLLGAAGCWLGLSAARGRLSDTPSLKLSFGRPFAFATGGLEIDGAAAEFNGGKPGVASDAAA